MATDEIYFPFLTPEVKCGNEALNIADRQNAYSASVAANAVVELITEQDGKDKWTAYKFTRNIYDIFLPIHLERICASVDQLPDPEVFFVEPLSQKSNTTFDSQLTASSSQKTESRLPCSQTSEPGI
ncbi:hypothetical protein ABVK25_010817 [Lepraria finkii]|uniref:DUF7924 domain-containing protein n=1 Tax=Lepraria finkii TaxID=1340010 RepID=A0ABR4AWE1_9LECA